jgi:hypothetical protein
MNDATTYTLYDLNPCLLVSLTLSLLVSIGMLLSGDVALQIGAVALAVGAWLLMLTNIVMDSNLADGERAMTIQRGYHIMAYLQIVIIVLLMLTFSWLGLLASIIVAHSLFEYNYRSS